MKNIKLLMVTLCIFGLSSCGQDPLGLTDSLNGACEGKWSTSSAQECWQDDESGCSDWNNRAAQNGGVFIITTVVKHAQTLV